MLRHMGTALRVTIFTIVLLGLIYPLAMTGIAQALFPETGKRLARYRQRQGRRLLARRSALDEAAVFSRAAVRRGEQGLRSNVDRRNEPWPNVAKAHRSHKSHDRATREGQPRRRRSAANGFSHLERQRYRSGHYSGIRVLGSAARSKSAPRRPRFGSRARGGTRRKDGSSASWASPTSTSSNSTSP